VKTVKLKPVAKPSKKSYLVNINMTEEPELYTKLKRSARLNFRTISQQALYYIWSGINIEKEMEDVK